MERELNLFTNTNEVRHIDLPNHVSLTSLTLTSWHLWRIIPLYHRISVDCLSSQCPAKGLCPARRALWVIISPPGLALWIFGIDKDGSRYWGLFAHFLIQLLGWKGLTMRKYALYTNDSKVGSQHWSKYALWNGQISWNIMTHPFGHCHVRPLSCSKHHNARQQSPQVADRFLKPLPWSISLEQKQKNLFHSILHNILAPHSFVNGLWVI